MSEKKPLGVVVVPVVYNNEILLIKREKEPYKGFLSMVGGKMEFGETIAETAEREVLEETSIPSKFVAVRGFVNEVLHDAKTREILDHFLLFFCEVVPKHNKHIDSHEGQLSWIKLTDLSKIKKQIVPSDYLMIQKFLIRNKPSLKLHQVKMLKLADDKYKIAKTDL